MTSSVTEAAEIDLADVAEHVAAVEAVAPGWKVMAKLLDCGLSVGIAIDNADAQARGEKRRRTARIFHPAKETPEDVSRGFEAWLNRPEDFR